MASVHRVDDGTLITKDCQIDNITFRINACIELQMRINPQREGEERRNPGKVSRSYFHSR